MERLKLGSAEASPDRPLIAVPLMATDEAHLQAQLPQFNAAQADVVEWRIDYWDDLHQLKHQLQTLLQRFEKPVILTYRSQAEGGIGTQVAWVYQTLYPLAIQSGVAALDVEARFDDYAPKLIALVQKRDTQVILSKHLWRITDKDFATELVTLAQSEADILKLAIQPRQAEDVVALLTATQSVSQTVTQPLITMAMGQIGQMSRRVGYRYGSQLTFASLTDESAPGQLALDDLWASFH
ncbi:3-dehydroquinate dehydratase-1 [Weissella uvarum]|uniref:type I 3-dehydroquinate dehydratase n=1 Tax=Weissella uvarum TaxID=1479233 RepID=UPI001960CC50|nr:type I 3-dehydroquinate dehydratase [Weissella uvarum]MBM7617167.1 3-dehydroquinate dehydratase-1 [Weissella uvarum]MCM0595463.1 type I 3-dehydroquinate dehydratase [Weissella uvarum]